MRSSVALYTLGCKLNFAESSTIAQQLEKSGFERKQFHEGADLYVINTCSVTDHADRKCKKVVAEALRHNSEAYIVVVGCYAQLKPEEISNIPGVDMVLGAAEKFQLIEHLHSLKKEEKTRLYNAPIKDVHEFVPGFSEGDRTRMFLKVQDGCDYNCSFCTIPMARGKSRSDNIANVVANAKTLAADGVKEIVLTGVNLGDFGKGPDGDLKYEENFAQLIVALDEVEGIDRYRISSIEPNLLTNEVIEWVATSKKFMPHFHIPLQSGSNDILKLMRRRYQKELYQERVDLIKQLMPHCAIGVDVIVGFPGETDKHFQETFEFLHQLDVSYLHVFTYSERTATKALDIQPIIPMAVRNERNKILRNLSYQKLQYFTQQHYQSTRKVLFENFEKNGMMEGYTDNYLRISTPFRNEWANQIVDWKIQ